MAPIGASRSHRAARPGEQGRAAKAAPLADPVAAQVLGLQRAAGNRAVRQVIARRPARHTGISSRRSIERYVVKAVKFWRRNKDLPVRHFAIYLGAAVNEELAAIGVPAVHVRVGNEETGAAAFYASSWEMVVDPKGFSKGSGALAIGDLTPAEAGDIAMTVYHEARHAEQNFRVARRFAAEHRELNFDLEEKAAEAAGHAPLGAPSALELREERDWETNVGGDDATYREAVTWWTAEASKAAKLAREVGAGDASAVRDRIGRLLHGWSKPGGAEETVRSHLSSAKSRKAARVVKNITRITAAFDRAETAWKQLGEDAQQADFAPLTDALGELNKAVYAAYGDQPVEDDAWDAGNAVRAAFKTAAAQ